ncbi:MAG: lectin-like domain-containing protein [Bacteroidales bacterium]
MVAILLINVLKVSAQQYNVAGSAVTMTSPGCYQLTNTIGQSGAVWNIYKINLSQSFDITLSLNFGNRPGTIGYVPATCGADGISFILQPLNTGVFGVGGGVGFHGITPSLGIVMDTYTDNTTDPSYQHISIHKNGDELHGTTNELKPPALAVGFPVNITDGLDHLFRFSWIPTSGGAGIINVYFGTATTLPITPTQTYTGNILNTIFLGDPNVYWGVSGSTGGCWNTQYVCMTTVANFASDTATCAGTPVIFTSNSISGLPITSYFWDFGDATFSTLQSPSHIFNNPGTYDVNLSIMNSGGFSSTMTHSVVVHPRPNTLVNNDTLCVGDTATLIATGASTYNWNNGLTPGAIKKVVPLITTSYIVTGLNSWGCSLRDTALVTVNPNPIITATSDTICERDTASLLASGANTYLWTPGNFTSNPLFISPTVSTQYKVIGTNVFGCKDSTTTNVIFYANPVITANDDTICLNETATLTANGGISYVWGNNFSTTNPLILSPNITSSYTLTGKDANNCIGRDTVVIIVNQPPVISVDSAEICRGITATLTVSGGSNLTYLWLNDNSTLNPLHTAPPTNTIYTVIATDFNGCKDTASGFVKVHPKPVPAFTSNPTTATTDAPIVVFTDQSTNTIAWFWDFGDIGSLINNNSILQSPSHAFSSAGNFTIWLRVMSDFGCLDSVAGSMYVTTPNYFYVPNAFVPSSGSPDVNVFKPKGIGIDTRNYLFIIFDRWGKEIYKTTEWEAGWNGRFDNTGDYLPIGVYVYYIKYKELFGVTKERSGSVTLVR